MDRLGGIGWRSFSLVGGGLGSMRWFDEEVFDSKWLRLVGFADS